MTWSFTLLYKAMFLGDGSTPTSSSVLYVAAAKMIASIGLFESFGVFDFFAMTIFLCVLDLV